MMMLPVSRGPEESICVASVFASSTSGASAWVSPVAVSRAAFTAPGVSTSGLRTVAFAWVVCRERRSSAPLLTGQQSAGGAHTGHRRSHKDAKRRQLLSGVMAGH